MKFLVLLLVLVVAYAVWRNGRRAAPDDADATPRRPSPPATASAPQDMVRCAVCALHLPRSDASTGTRGLYCSAEHLRQAEG